MSKVPVLVRAPTGASGACVVTYAEVVESEPIFFACNCIDSIDDVRGDIAAGSFFSTIVHPMTLPI
jgi:hypothetical protein